MFKGSLVALITPFNEKKEVDYATLDQLIDFHLYNQTDGLVILGTTGESPTITETEHQRIIKQVVGRVKGKIPVIAGVGKNDTQATLHLAKITAALGVDALLIVTPYYNKPTQEGLYQHYSLLAQEVNIPQILYNVPGRTGVDLLPETVKQLSLHTNIVAIKETTTLERVQALRNAAPNMSIYCGDDASNLPMLKAGAIGLISVTANVAPQLLHIMCRAFFAGDLAQAEKIHEQLGLLNKNLFLEANPIPVKYCAAKLKLVENYLRLPMTPLSEKFQRDLDEAMKQAGVLHK
jgi:4-hydroxy-tetrahydrodipicolinate synthase